MATSAKKRKLRKPLSPKRYGRWVRFDGFTYPLPMPDLEWKCRYNPEALDKGDLLAIASLMNAYFWMITHDTQKKRNYVCSEIQKIIESAAWLKQEGDK